MSHMQNSVLLNASFQKLNIAEGSKIETIQINKEKLAESFIPDMYVYKAKEQEKVQNKFILKGTLDSGCIKSLSKEGFKLDLEGIEKSGEKLRCMYTLEYIENTIPIGIPIFRKTVGDKVLFHCVDIFGSFNAALAELRKRKDSKTTGYIYKNSEQYLLELFDEYHPNEELIPFPDQRLLQIFNGPLDYNKFCGSTKKLTGAKSRYICVPMVEEYSGIRI